jgi:hypothetical protein
MFMIVCFIKKTVFSVEREITLILDASYQVSVHLAKRLIRREEFLKSANQKQESPMAAMFVNGSG